MFTRCLRAERIAIARRAEAAAMAFDPRITNSQGGHFDAATGRKVLANSRGFLSEYQSSYCGISAAPLAIDANGAMQRDFWSSSARRIADLESPESIGEEAARRALRRLGARRVPTQRVPIVFAPEIARSLIGHLFEAASGDSIWRSASFLAGQLGESIAAPSITIVDDHTMILANGVGGFGTSPFDGEGLPTRRTVFVENGVLQTYLLNTYTARKLGCAPQATPRVDWRGAPASALAICTCCPEHNLQSQSLRKFQPASMSPA
jgi:PmbA protein